MKKPSLVASGQIRGDLSELKPFLYIAKQGGLPSGHKRKSEACKGLYWVNEVCGSGAYPRTGVVLPIESCQDDGTREAFTQLVNLLRTGEDFHSMVKARRQAQRTLNDAFGDAVQIEHLTDLDGFVSLKPSKGLFSLLSRYFVYVDAISDNPSGVARPVSYKRFAWESYGLFMEWFYDRIEGATWGWEHIRPYLVFGETCVLDFPGSRNVIERPSFDPAKYFCVAPHVTNARSSVSFTMGRHGTVTMHIELDTGESVDVCYSDCWSPFRTMIEWIKMVDHGDIPAQFDIDEEVTDKRLLAYSTDDVDRILLEVRDPYDPDEVFLAGIVDRLQFVRTFRSALREFFDKSFNPDLWDASADGDPTMLRASVLGDPWFSKANPSS